MTIAGIQIEVERKKIKHTHLAVYPPDARVHVSAPEDLSDRDLRSFLASKIGWIRDQRKVVLAQPRQTHRQYVSGESIYCLGCRYRLAVVETSPHAAKRRTPHAAKRRTPHAAKRRTPHAAKRRTPHAVEGVAAYGTRLELRVRAGASRVHKEKLVESWQKAILGECLAGKIKTWCRKLKLALPEIEVRKMKTRWASCHQKRNKIVFNAALGRVPVRCIEYVVVHELTHFEVLNHSEAFVKLMNGRLPRWRLLRKELNDFIAMPMEEV